ncbi:MAG TPA: maleylpyruvate isomerase N-terminal domain-containing protein [Acidimicrobiales bacterium]|nr:maleylpyruvate isomerase N-terminal domain-containing protein [Acidimicrobiales bacterium]
MVEDVAVWLGVLERSHHRLTGLARELDEQQLRAPSYCDDWSIAQVLSHLGSGAEIVGAAVAAVAAGERPPSRDTYPAVWDRWNAMSPREMRDQGLAADEGYVVLLQRLGSVLDKLELTLFGGMRLDGVGLVGARLSEHAVHTWDVTVALDPYARVAPDAVSLLVDRLPRIGTRLGTPAHVERPTPLVVGIVTAEPDRRFDLRVDDAVSLTPDDKGPPQPEELHLPAEALLRLAYGRLDPAAPDVEPAERSTLETLQRVFRGF